MASQWQSRPPVEQLSKGLDRAPHNVYDNPERHLISPLQPEKPEELTTSSSDSKLTNDPKPDIQGKLHRISKKFSNNVKSKADIVLHPTHHKKEKTTDSTTVPILAPPPTDKADDDRLFHKAPSQTGASLQDIVKHPISTAETTFNSAGGAKFAATMDNQVVAHGADVRLVRAYDELVNAESEKGRINAADSLEELKKARQDSFVRWTMDRHVLMETLKQKAKMENLASSGQIMGTIYLVMASRLKSQKLNTQQLLRYFIEHYGDQYIDDNPNFPKPTEEAFNTIGERLIMISTPYQTLLMTIRRIYRWDNPSETARYLVAYVVLWLMNYITGAAIFALICIVLKRRYQAPTLEDIRADIKRSEDVEMTAMNLTQLIEQRGSHKWLAVLETDVGPWALQQLEDLANVLEVWRNFYEWREPTRTKITLVILTVCWLTITFIPLHLLIKTTQFAIGVIFFGLWPVATHYPQYRLVVSPVKWLLWRIPTDAEWAIARLQAEATYRKEGMQKAHLTSNPDSPASANPENNTPEKPYIANLGKYLCTSRNHLGELHVSSEGVKYVSAVRKHILWELRFEHVKLMEKVGGGEGLRFVGVGGEEFRVGGLRHRNEVFTQIVGYSGLRWRVAG